MSTACKLSSLCGFDTKIVTYQNPGSALASSHKSRHDNGLWTMTHPPPSLSIMCVCVSTYVVVLRFLCERTSMCIRMCMWMNEEKYACVWDKGRECEWVSKRERVCICVCVCACVLACARVKVLACSCMCVSEKESVCMEDFAVTVRRRHFLLHNEKYNGM